MSALLVAHGAGSLAGEGISPVVIDLGVVATAVLVAIGLRARGPVPVGGPAVPPLTLDGAEAGSWPGDALPPWARVVGQVLGVAALGGALLVGWAGSELSGLNPLPLLLVLVWWTVPLLAWALGDWWRVIDPHDALADVVDRLLGRPAPGPSTTDHEARDWWLPALLLASFAWMATCWLDGLQPRHLAAWLTALAVLLLVGAVAAGRDWVRRTSPLAVVTGAVAAASPVDWGGGHPSLRSPFRGLAERAGGRRTMAALVVLLGATVWEAVAGTQWWSDLSGGGSDRALIWSTFGLVWCTLLVAVAWLLVGRLAEAVATRRAETELHEPLAADLALALGPLAAAAPFAHQLSTWLVYVQDLAVLGLDPLSRGWDLLGSSAWRARRGPAVDRHGHHPPGRAAHPRPGGRAGGGVGSTGGAHGAERAPGRVDPRGLDRRGRRHRPLAPAGRMMATVEAVALVLAHQGGWDEVLLILTPIAIFAGLLAVANHRARAQQAARGPIATDDGDDGPGDGTGAAPPADDPT